MQRNWIGRSVGADVALPGRGARGRRHRGVHDAPRHAVRRHVHGARARAPARRRRSCRPSGPTRPSRPTSATCPPRGRASSASTSSRPRRCAATASSPRRRASSNARPRAREKTGVFTGAFAVNPTNGGHDPDLRRRLRADGLRHRRDHGGARARPARLRVRAGVRAADRRRGAAARRLAARPRASTADTPARRVARGVRRRRRRR